GDAENRYGARVGAIGWAASPTARMWGCEIDRRLPSTHRRPWRSVARPAPPATEDACSPLDHTQMSQPIERPLSVMISFGRTSATVVQSINSTLRRLSASRTALSTRAPRKSPLRDLLTRITSAFGQAVL